MSRDIDAEIATLKEQLANIPDQPTEVYTRIVGYYRSVKNWNKGKKDEYRIRKTFNIKRQDAEPQVLGMADMAGDILNCGDISGPDK